MAIQQLCDVCEESWAEDTLVLINHNHKMMCPTCINDLVDDLVHNLDMLRHVEEAIEIYNLEKR